VYVDPQSALKSLATKFENVEIDVGGAGDYVPKVDAKIRRIKARYRSIKNGLPWQIPPAMIKDLVAYVVSRINIERSAAINLSVAPKVLFTGMRVDFRKEFGLAFGDYCEVYDGTDNTSKPRSVPCVALYPCNNAAGSWAFMNLHTRQRIRRTQWIKMVTKNVIISAINAFNDVSNGDQENADTGIQSGAEASTTEVEKPEKSETQLMQSDAGAEVGSLDGIEDCPELVPQEEDDSDDEADSEDEAEDEAEDTNRGMQEATADKKETRRSERIKQGIAKPGRFAATTVKLRSKVLDKTGKIALAREAEIRQVFEELKALEPVEKRNIPPGLKPLGCHLFTVQKYDASGGHDKYKSRLVSHGNEQDTSLYPDRSSPTVSVHAIMTCLAIAACNATYTMGKIDVKGAFIQTEMSGTPVYIKCGGNLKKQILGIYPAFSKYVGPDGLMPCYPLLDLTHNSMGTSSLQFP
jgi:hypothetical protein